MARPSPPRGLIANLARRARLQGFSLTELVAVVAIVGLLASIAVPAYRAQVLRANRADARAALLTLAAAEEKFYLQCNSYTPTLDDTRDTSCSPASLRFATGTERGNYTIAVTAADGAAWTATATAVGGGPQAMDTRCRVFQLTSTGARTAKTSGGAANDLECWSR
jgi:type IV pilus assembly protein PilE